MLTCECHEAEYGYIPPQDFSTLQTKQRKRCWSCGHLIDIGAVVLEFSRCREVRSDVEEDIYGEAVPLAPKYHCETCGETFLNLEAAGYCLDPSESMAELLDEYQELTNFERRKGA